ncbi:CoA-binding protein [Flavobacterium sp. DG1-102-2]|uniref:CoA-binding protein n=1 Tax=Flavobacterium sp. DG1-102-2 TaxID=3081663 RepID=UPI0029492723|nr:CoA-binding protein [Flavobacterium sp. DG1-102-2]MDV6168361.1 CoA-binding protein [Flavobacterium sp. DG1-102-2]
MASSKKTLVMGASTDPGRYSYKAIKMLQRFGHPVVAVGKRQDELDGITIEKEHIPFADVDTVTLYLNPMNQKQYYDYIIGLKPERIIFNPGTENPELYALLRENGIEIEVACTLVMLSTHQY